MGFRSDKDQCAADHCVADQCTVPAGYGRLIRMRFRSILPVIRAIAVLCCLGMAVQAMAAGATGAAGAARASDARAPGPHFPLTKQAHVNAPSSRTGSPVVGTTYFYWYDVYSGAHIRNADGTDALTTHPPSSAMPDLSYKSIEWHYSQLRDVREAGIDFILPVFWGTPGESKSWCFEGLPPLVAAHERMLVEAKANPSRPEPPRIGMFYDTSTLQMHGATADGIADGQKIDLTKDAGRDWFYATIRDYFSMIPPDKWARVDGKPIVFLYSAGFAKAVDDKLFPDVQRRFRKDFGCELFIVREQSWHYTADASYGWGGALGLNIGDGVAGLGPGYDHSAVSGRKPLVVSRQNGGFYSQQWDRLLRMQPGRRPWMVHVETWNEWHEGTDIARSQEYGDQYVRATAKYAKMFRDGVRIDPRGLFARADRVNWFARLVEGIELVSSGGDGCWQALAAEGSPAIVSMPCASGAPSAFLYFRVDDSYLYDEQNRSVEIAVVFRDDGGCGNFQVEYDNGNAGIGTRDGAFRPSNPVTVGSTGTWRTVRQVLTDVRFIGRTNNADFRLAVTGGQARLTVREVSIRKLSGVEYDLKRAGKGKD